ncbi:MAG: PD-(D/E)XK nuclease family protein, partial [bacterium]
MRTQFVNSKNRLVDETAAWLEKAVRLSCAGAKTLDHILVVVPTRQAGRRLRLALAQRLGACVPPRILLPANLLATAEDSEPLGATEAERIGVLASLLGTLDLSSYASLFPRKNATADRSFSWRLGIASQLDDVWRTLGENALTMADVAAFAESSPDVLPTSEEVERWKQLAAIEALLFAQLRELGRCHPAEARKRGIAQPAIPEGVKEIVLPALVDAQPAFFKAMEQVAQQNSELTVTILLHAPENERDLFDVWGRPDPDAWTADRAPVIPLREGQYILTANSAQQAEAAAELIKQVEDNEELPGIGLADEDLFPDLQSALLARGKRLHNPAAMPLLHSSLGHLVAQISQLLTRPTYAVFAAWLRESDTQRYFEKRFRQNKTFSFLGVLRALDALHKQHLPQDFPDVQTCVGSNPEWWPLCDVVEVVKDWLRPKVRQVRFEQLRGLLGEIVSARPLHEQKAGDRELLAAAEALNEAVDAADCELVRRVLPDDAERALLFDSLLGSATYSLEPDDPACLLTDGWLELAWNPAAELVICGFNEESVPESVVGHAFVPDSLRKALGLTHNEQRTARDTYLFRALLLAREQGAVTVLLERMNARGDIRKPSRLLFLCGDDDATFAARAIRLYQDSKKPASGFARSLPDAWRLRLSPVPLAVESPAAGWPPVAIPEKLSVTMFKDYLACPFSFFLRHVLKMKAVDDRDRELDAMEFGSLCHSVLEAFGKEACTCRNSCDA